MKHAIAESPEPIIDCMRPSSTTDIEVRKQLVRATTWLKLASIAGLPIRWWDEDEHRWHTERDWRDEDHEHYRERP
jgi:hypothetical protein